MFILGVDVGGTFTDLVAMDLETGEIRTTKILSVKDNPGEVLANGISELGLADTTLKRVVHGTTVATNALIERRGARTALVTTQGFRDTIEIGRGRRLVYGAMFDSRFRRAKPLVPRSRRIEVCERINAQGEATTKLDLKHLREAFEDIRSEKVTAIAICFLHSYRNSDHERAVAAVIRDELGSDIFLSVSGEVDPRFREFERFSTTVVNAYVGPVTRAHIRDLRKHEAVEKSENTFVMGSSGGVMDFDTAAKFPVRTILSGPAGGVTAARSTGNHLGFEKIITCDMGGTSTDVALLAGEQLLYANETIVSGIPVRASQLDINTIAAGAGSLIWIDVDGALRVGPASAGSMPGPACYGRGGQLPTVTDANVALNRISDGTLLGGKLRVDTTAAVTAFDSIRNQLGLESVPKLAEGALQIAEVKIVSAIREISLERGFDPRDFALMVFGGAGPMHGCLVAERLGMRHVIIPNEPGVFSAFGLILGNMRCESIVSYLARLTVSSVPTLRELLSAASKRLSEQLLSAKVIPQSITLTYVLEMRCKGQSHEIAVPIKCELRELSQESVNAAFHDAYSARYGQPPDSSIDREIVTVRIVCEGRTEQLPPKTFPMRQRRAPTEKRPVWFGNNIYETEIYKREDLATYQTILGPAIINEIGATTILPPQWQLRVHETGALLLEQLS